MSQAQPPPQRAADPEDDGPVAAAAALLEAVAAFEPGIGAGFVAGLAVSLAAAVVATAARASRAGWSDAGAIAAQAEALRRRSAPLAGEDARAHADALAALRAAAEKQGSVGDERLGETLSLAAEVPLRIAEAAADVADLAAVTSTSADEAVRADANAAAAIAAAAAAVCARLVEVNLTAAAGDPRVKRAVAAEAAARTASERA